MQKAGLMRLLISAVLLCLVSFQTAHAQGREKIGSSSLFSNDFLGDRGDRWRTGNFTYSHLRALQPYTGPSNLMGDVLEYRLRTQIISPAGGTDRPGDRPFVGAVSLAVNTHFADYDTLYSLGVELTAIGPQTGMSEFQRDFHERFSLPQPPFTDAQLDDRFLVSVMGEEARQRQLTDLVSMRTFLGFEVGAEALVRVGADLRFSAYGHDDLMLRDVVTGQLHAGTANDGTGWALVAGADLAHVLDSVYLPEDRVDGIEATRFRARAGIDYKFTGSASAFYGLTYLGPEFIGQPEGQILGSLRLKLNF